MTILPNRRFAIPFLTILAIIGLNLTLVREAVRISELDVEELVTYVPDDTFFYLTIVKNAHQEGRISFDGESSTTGFHYLHFAILFVLYPFFSSPDVFVVAASTISGVFFALGLMLFLTLFDGKGKTVGQIVFLLILLNSELIHIVLGGLEIGVTVFALGLHLFAVKCFVCAERKHARWPGVAIFATSILCLLARTDLAFILFLFCFYPLVCRPPQLRFAVNLSFALAVAELIHIGITYSLSGELTQDSAAVKMLMRDVSEENEVPYWSLSSFLDLPGLMDGKFNLSTATRIWFAIFEGVLFSFLFVLAAKARRFPPEHTWFPIFLLSGTFALGAAYQTLVVHVQVWYLVIPALAVSFAVAFLIQQLVTLVCKHPKGFYWVFGMSTVGVGLIIYLPAQRSEQISWPWQKAMYHQASVLRDLVNRREITGKVGSWNPGILSYYSDVNVVDLTGLANTDFRKAVATRKRGEVASVALRKGVNYFFDWESAFQERIVQLLWGEEYLLGMNFLPVRTFRAVPGFGTPKFILARYSDATRNLNLQAESPNLVGSWKIYTHKEGYQHDFVMSAKKGDYLRLRTSEPFSVRYFVHDWSGMVGVEIDGLVVETLDLYSANPGTRIHFISGDHSVHQYKFIVLGRKNSRSHSTQVWLDAVVFRK